MIDINDLITQAKQFESIPERSRKTYSKHRDTLIEHVNQVVLNNVHLKQLLNNNNYQLLQNNHRNHAHFMAEILHNNQIELLVRSIPWVYRTYHNQGIDYDYFDIELRAWIHVLKSQLGLEQVEPIIALYEWLVAQHTVMVELARNYQMQLPTEHTDISVDAKCYHQSLEEANFRHCIEICKHALTAGMSLPEVFHSIIYPSMVRVGDCWERGNIDVAEEHRSTAITNSVLGALYYDMEMPPKTMGKAIVSAVPNERHEMGAWMLSMCLELDGWEVFFLGSDLPASAIVNAVKEQQADLLALSVAMPFNIESAREAIEQVRFKCGTQVPKIMVGGQVLQRYPELTHSLNADCCLANLIEAVEWCRYKMAA